MANQEFVKRRSSEAVEREMVPEESVAQVVGHIGCTFVVTAVVLPNASFGRGAAEVWEGESGRSGQNLREFC